MSSAIQRRRGDVLIVDDEPEMRDFLATLLSDEGYAVRQASNGLEALALITAKPPALVLLDFMMPLMDGSSLLTILQRRYTTIPLAFITAAPHSVVTLHAQEAIFSKPIEIEALLAFVGQYVLPRVSE